MSTFIMTSPNHAVEPPVPVSLSHERLGEFESVSIVCHKPLQKAPQTTKRTPAYDTRTYSGMRGVLAVI